MTPSGTRTRSMVMPFGRVQLSVTAPMGSGSTRTTSMPSAIPATILGVRVSRSRNAAFVPAAFTSATSSAFAARMPASLARIDLTIAASAVSRWAAGDSASVRAAAFARRPMSAIASAMLVPSIDFSGAVMRSSGAFLPWRNPAREAQKKGRRKAPQAVLDSCRRLRAGDHDAAFRHQVAQHARQVGFDGVVIPIRGSPDGDCRCEVFARAVPRHEIFGQPAGRFPGFELSGNRFVQVEVHCGAPGESNTPDNAAMRSPVPQCNNCLNRKAIRLVAGVDDADAPAVRGPDAFPYQATTTVAVIAVAVVARIAAPIRIACR